MITFQYKKSDTDITDRVGFVLHRVTDNFLVLEANEVENKEALEQELAAILVMNQQNIQSFVDKYGLQYKNFKASKMLNIKES